MSQNQNPIPNRYTPNQSSVGARTALSDSPGVASTLGVKPDARLANAFLTQAFVWMFAGLLVTAGVAAFVTGSESLLRFAQGNFLILFIAQMGIVIAISGAINRISASVALLLFFIYAATLGITIGLIVSTYSGANVSVAFLSSSAMFGAAAIYGHVTKRSLAKLGGILFMGIIGLLVAMVVNLFLGSALISYVVSVIGVVLFTALTAYDVQRIQSGELAAATGSMEKGAVIGALRLYLDFINLFLFMLRLTSGRN